VFQCLNEQIRFFVGKNVASDLFPELSRIAEGIEQFTLE